MKKKILSISLLSLLILLVAFLTPALITVIGLENNMCITLDELETSRLDNGVEISLRSPDLAVSQSGYTTAVVNVKLFGLIPIRSLPVTVITDTSVRAGGELLGFDLKSTGIIILGFNSVLTKSGEQNPAHAAGLKVGDVITKVGDSAVNSLADIDAIINAKQRPDKVTVTYLRSGKEHTLDIAPALDIISKKSKLGLWVKSSSNGIGTLSYIRGDGRYGAVGHSITEEASTTTSQLQSGEVFDTKILGVKKGTRNSVGEIRASIDWQDLPIGSVDTNCKYGLFGNIDDESKGDKNYELGGRLSIRPGKAKIRASVDSSGVAEYDIEIVKAISQKKSNDKSIIFKVTDKTLLETTGGIIQGMSGSPIIQNGKIVGTVTHVFLNDPTRGYGVYIDWMINK